MSCACGSPVRAKGKCMRCYLLAYKRKPLGQCACGREIKTKGVCSTCYNRTHRRAQEYVKTKEYKDYEHVETLPETLARYQSCYSSVIGWAGRLFWSRQIRELNEALK